MPARAAVEKSSSASHTEIRTLPLSLAICRSKTYNSHLSGVDPERRVHVADRLLRQNDGPMLEVLKKLHRDQLHLPARRKDWPDQERLALRFDEFRGYE